MENATKKLYENDAYLKKFTAKVLSCEENNGAYDVVLDQSAFFPEGGGQKGDIGTLGEATVTDTQVKEEVIIHKTDKPLEVGAEVCGEINWEVRYERMQNHSAEHIVSGIASTKFDCNNVGFHMSDASMTVDFDKKLSDEAIAEIELASNRAVYANIDIVAIYPTDEEIPTLRYRSKKAIDGVLRLIRIGDVDFCACCAPHVLKTGEIGAIKIIDAAPYKGGTRIEIVAGPWALNDYSRLNADSKAIMKMLSAPRDKMPEFVSRQLEQIAQLNREKQALVRELAMMKLSVTKVGENGYSFCDKCTYDDLRFCSNSVVESGTTLCVLLSETTENEFIYVMNSKTAEITSVLKQLNATFSGKGGGNPHYAQGKLSGAKADIESALNELLK